MEAHQRSEEGTNQGYKLAENGNTACDAVRDDGDTEGARKPRDPVEHRVGRKVLRVSQGAYEHILGGQLVLLVLVLCRYNGSRLT